MKKSRFWAYFGRFLPFFDLFWRLIPVNRGLTPNNPLKIDQLCSLHQISSVTPSPIHIWLSESHKKSEIGHFWHSCHFWRLTAVNRRLTAVNPLYRCIPMVFIYLPQKFQVMIQKNEELRAIWRPKFYPRPPIKHGARNRRRSILSISELYQCLKRSVGFPLDDATREKHSRAFAVMYLVLLWRNLGFGPILDDFCPFLPVNSG